MLEMRDEDLVELIIHELAHSTVYINNQTAFNETFANFVGKTGARMFYVDKFGENSAEVINFDMVNKQEKEYNNFFQELYTKLDKIYTSNIADSEKLSQQQNTLQNAKNNYNKLEVSKYYTIKNWNQINNAYLLAFKTYNHDEAVFSDLFRLVNNNFSQFLHQVAKNSIGPDPFAALRQHINYIVSNQ
jgi:predicted aminopeptidase